MTLSRLAADLAGIIAESNNKKVQTDELLSRAQHLRPGLVGDPAIRTELRSALGELAAAGRVTLPATGSPTGWDRRAVPAIPLWVMRADRSPARPGRPASRVWPRALEKAGLIATRADEFQLLDRLAEWLRENPDPTMVPVQERSAEIFGDEKAIDNYLKNRLFTSGALSLEMIGCFQPPLPFPAQHVPGTAPTRLLVLENLATYTSFLTALRELPPEHRPDLHVAWGGGNGFARSVLSVPLLRPEPRAIRYFGDIDLAGLQTAVSAATLATRQDQARIRPAIGCYSYLVNRRAEWARPDASNKGTGSDHDELTRWFPEPERSLVSELLAARKRIPQERLGLKALRDHPEIWTML